MINLLMFFMVFSFLLIFILLMLFFFLSKLSLGSITQSSAFECGFTSYFFSRFSFSIHYFGVSLIFLFLDLELCFLLPLFNEESSSVKETLFLWSVVLVLLGGLLKEWGSGELDWKF